MLIPAYCSLEFIEDISKKGSIDFMDPERSLSKSKAFMNTADLIFNGLSIKTDCSKEKINEKILNPFIKHLIKERKIEPAENDFKAIRLSDINFLESIVQPTNLFLLSGVSKSLINEYEQKFGHFFLNIDSPLNVLFDQQVQNFEPNQQSNWEFAKRFFDPHNALIVADPYLFKEQNLKALRELLLEIIPRHLKTKYVVTLLGYDSTTKNDLPDKKRIEILIKNIIQTIKRGITMDVEYFIYNGVEFHDRYFITNNACIFSGSGAGIVAKNIVKKDGTWIAIKPFSKIDEQGNKFFFDEMQSKLSLIKKWIRKNYKEGSKNRLLKFPTYE